MNDALRKIMEKYDKLHEDENNFDLEKSVNVYNDNNDPYDYRNILNKLETVL